MPAAHFLTVVLTLLTACACAVDAPPSARTAGPSNELSHAVGIFTNAYATWDHAGFVTAMLAFEAAGTAAPTSALAHYWLGTAAFHAALSRASSAEAGANDPAARAMAALETALRLAPDDPECHALLSSLVGLQIAAAPLSAVWRGPRVSRHRQAALRLGSDNPRVHYLVGSGYYHAPGRLRDRQQALQCFLRAETLFEQEQRATRAACQPGWGYDSCLVFIADIYAAAGDGLQARAYYEKALRANPANRRAREARAGPMSEQR